MHNMLPTRLRIYLNLTSESHKQDKHETEMIVITLPVKVLTACARDS